MTLKTYLVGGSVRDTLLDLPVKDKDFVVVGATPQDLLDLGFTQIGVDFPVFLHPYSHDEYALARTERKTGQGYQGFSVDTTNVSLKDDLLRRDLTINAMAIQTKGLFDDTPKTTEIIDPYGGQKDLADKTLRHISGAFDEDPLRVLRVARFFARFFGLGFHVHPDTVKLMQQIANRGELSQLSCERIWTETTKALDEVHGFAYFSLLDKLGILPFILPNLATSWANNPAAKSATFTALAAAFHQPIRVKFSLLISVFLNDPNQLAQLNAIASTLKIPNAIKNFAQLFLVHHDDLIDLKHLKADTLLKLIENTKAHKGDDSLFKLMDAVDILHGTNLDKNYLKSAISTYQSVSIHDVDTNLKGKAIGDELTRLRIMALQALSRHTDDSI
ncbi:tRNA nucleotidyltransferase [Moraxella nasovis]|uniref:tRNA nucleotidyltransferase n=1 Tax=Moraxella nasovis TaxID=2904121 RepID=UPI001F62199C|nr:tRNA nucleotidyltransferase [Moraxella nasovis]UNU73753.1 tRNA nucleotidyltransferase [Moraxella nasovis]